MGQNSSQITENYTPIHKRKQLMTATELAHSINQYENYDNDLFNTLTELMTCQESLTKLLNNANYVSPIELREIAEKIHEQKKIIEDKTGVFIFPDVDKTPSNNVYLQKENEAKHAEYFGNYKNNVLYEPNKNMIGNNFGSGFITNYDDMSPKQLNAYLKNLKITRDSMINQNGNKNDINAYGVEIFKVERYMNEHNYKLEAFTDCQTLRNKIQSAVQKRYNCTQKGGCQNGRELDKEILRLEKEILRNKDCSKMECGNRANNIPSRCSMTQNRNGAYGGYGGCAHTGYTPCGQQMDNSYENNFDIQRMRQFYANQQPVSDMGNAPSFYPCNSPNAPQTKECMSTPLPERRRVRFDDNDYSDDDEQQPCPCQAVNKEGFVSSGGLGANYNKGMDTITGPSLFTNQILQNGTTWNKLKDTVNSKGYASDGPNSIGAGPGNNFDSSMSAHIRNMEIMQSANNEYNTPQMLKEINKNINKDISGGTNTSLYNRGAQTKGKIITLNDKAVGVLPEEFYPERAKNRNIYKTQEIIPIAGFNINEARIGENLSEIHPVLYLSRSHKRMATGAGTTGNISQFVGKIDAPKFDAKVGRTGNDRVSGPAAMNKKKENFTTFDEGAMTGEDNFRGAFKAAEGGSYWMPKRFQY